jgi:hypothetical protein
MCLLRDGEPSSTPLRPVEPDLSLAQGDGL